MSSPLVELTLRNPLTQVAAFVSDYLYFQGTRTANTIGRAKLVVPGDFDADLLRRGVLVDAWWTPYAPYTLRPWRVYEVQKATYKDDTSGLRVWEVEAVDLKHILTKRRVRAYKGSTQADKRGPVESVIKSYVSDHQRGLDKAYGLTIAPTYGIGPTVSKEAARANLYTVLTDLVKAAAETTRGTQVYFDILESYTANGLTTRLECWVGEMGTDQGLGSPVPLILSKSGGTISSLSYSVDGEKEVNRVDVGGGKDGADRPIVTVEDSTRAYAFPGAVVEGWAEKTDTSDMAVLADMGHKELRANDVKSLVTVTFTDSLAVRIGRDFDLGDRVLLEIEALDVRLPARLSSLVLTNDKGKVSVQGTLGIFEVTDG